MACRGKTRPSICESTGICGCADAASDQVAVGTCWARWHRLGVTALKDGTGVALDAAALLRLAGSRCQSCAGPVRAATGRKKSRD